jgi:hypothetical protein
MAGTDKVPLRGKAVNATWDSSAVRIRMAAAGVSVARAAAMAILPAFELNLRRIVAFCACIEAVARTV